MHVDEAWLVLDKPAGLLAVPGRGEAGRDNLASRAQALHANALVVHRLDMSTSGLLVMALGAQVQSLLNKAFAKRQVHKRYVALVEGEVQGASGEIDAPLAADWPNRPRQVVDTARGKPSLTRWLVLDRGAGFTRLALEPITGRSHQLRVHLQSIGHPIMGDDLYSPAADQYPRLMLHACRLQLDHPHSGLPCTFVSPVPF